MASTRSLKQAPWGRCSFEAFGNLVPIMAEVGADPGEPQVAPIRNIIKG